MPRGCATSLERTEGTANSRRPGAAADRRTLPRTPGSGSSLHQAGQGTGRRREDLGRMETTTQDASEGALARPACQGIVLAHAARRAGRSRSHRTSSGSSHAPGSLPAMFCARELIELQVDYRRHYRDTHRISQERLTWSRPGRVWAIDHSEAPGPIDGVYPAILAVRDLGSGCQLAWLPVPDMEAVEHGPRPGHTLRRTWPPAAPQERQRLGLPQRTRAAPARGSSRCLVAVTCANAALQRELRSGNRQHESSYSVPRSP